MSLSTEDIRQVIEYLNSHPGEWLPTNVLDLSGRITRVESELSRTRELMVERFDAMDQRFESMQVQMDRRFESMQTQLDQRFDESGRHLNRWMTAMIVVLSLVGLVVSAGAILG